LAGFWRWVLLRWRVWRWRWSGRCRWPDCCFSSTALRFFSFSFPLQIPTLSSLSATSHIGGTSSIPPSLGCHLPDPRKIGYDTRLLTLTTTSHEHLAARSHPHRPRSPNNRTAARLLQTASLTARRHSILSSSLRPPFRSRAASASKRHHPTESLSPIQPAHSAGGKGAQRLPTLMLLKACKPCPQTQILLRFYRPLVSVCSSHLLSFAHAFSRLAVCLSHAVLEPRFHLSQCRLPFHAHDIALRVIRIIPLTLLFGRISGWIVWIL